MPVQCGDEFGVGALPVRLTVVGLVRRQCGGLGAGRCTGGGALRCGWCGALQCGLVDEGEQRAGLQPDAVVG